jgi:hypothetical protein
LHPFRQPAKIAAPARTSPIEERMAKKPKVTKPGTVQKVIQPPYPQAPEKAEIAVEGADHLYREIRIENTLEDATGKKVKLKEGAQVDVTVEADAKDTVPKSTP